MFLLLEWDNPLSCMWKGERKAWNVPWCRMRSECSRAQWGLLLRAALGASREPGALTSPGQNSLGSQAAQKCYFPPKTTLSSWNILKKDVAGQTQSCHKHKLHVRQRTAVMMPGCIATRLWKHLSYGGSLKSYLMLLHPKVQYFLGILMCWLCAALYYVDTTLGFT